MNYIERAVRGEDVDIDDFIDSWHAGAGNGKTLPQYLGMTEEEYRRWAEADNDDVLVEIIGQRRARGLTEDEAQSLAAGLKYQARHHRNQAAQFESMASLIETRYNLLPGGFFEQLRVVQDIVDEANGE